MPNNPLKGFLIVTPYFNGKSEWYLFLIVVGMFLVGAVMAVVELLRWWKRQTGLYIKPPSRVFNLLSSILNASMRPLERNPSENAEVERRRSLSKAA